MTHQVYALGDSVMQGAGPDLYNTLPRAVPDIDVDAIAKRQFHQAPELVTARTGRPPLPDTIVVHLGTNGLLSNAHFDHLVASAPTATKFVILNVHAPRDWTDTVNQRLADGVHRHRTQTRLLDWSQIAMRHPEYLKKDGFHLSRPGATAYAAAIAVAIHA